jgi:uncharacterized protein
MMDFTKIIGFDWDNGNDGKNDKHGVSKIEAEQCFFNVPLLVANDDTHSLPSEARYHALGKTDTARVLFITFTLRESETLIRVISARSANRKEKASYEKNST